MGWDWGAHFLSQPDLNDTLVRLEHLATNQMIADDLTKAINHISQRQLVEDLGLA